MPPRVDVYIIGLGVLIPGHITIQATRAMSECAELYSIVGEPSSLWVPRGKKAEAKVFRLLDFYQENKPRRENYTRATQTIIDAIAPGKSVGYVTYGNPMCYDRVAQNLFDCATKSSFSVRVVPGISSVDTLLCDLGVDMAPGIQVFDSSWLLMCQIEPLPEFPMLLMQVGAFGSLRTHYTQRQDGKSLEQLARYLSRFYLQSHALALVRSSGEEDHPSRVKWVTLKDLCEVTAEDL